MVISSLRQYLLSFKVNQTPRQRQLKCKGKVDNSLANNKKMERKPIRIIGKPKAKLLETKSKPIMANKNTENGDQDQTNCCQAQSEEIKTKYLTH